MAAPARAAAPRTAAPRHGAAAWLLPLAALAVWLVETGGALWRTSHWSHYVLLADAFNHGQLHLFHHPTDAGDMAILGERAYVVFGPLPAVPLMPLTALLGPRTPDVAVLVLTALFAIFAFHRLLESLAVPPDGVRRAAVTLTLALGTAMHYGAPMGSVWLHAQISALALQCWALWMAAEGRTAWSGVALGLTVLTRPTATIAAPLAAWLIARRRALAGVPSPAADRAPRAGAVLRAAARLAVPVAIAVAIHGAYNYARFGNVADAGYHDLFMGETFQALVARWGRFNLHFLPGNLYGWFLRGPILGPTGLVPDPHGMSVLLTTPLLLVLLAPRRPAATELVALGTAALIAVPSLLYYNDGWVQFGQRFALDGIAPALVACAYAARRVPTWLVVALAGLGIAVNTWGMVWFQATMLH